MIRSIDYLQTAMLNLAQIDGQLIVWVELFRVVSIGVELFGVESIGVELFRVEFDRGRVDELNVVSINR
jgi:hypothetical protein